ncbi:HesB/IscA family protein [Plastoroseomonas arctica]|uniref:Iron-sulfur cluster assembly accessory protein n=1 Tax=Plastoroseomonas arctica TaxID=1509237 RepID=A0AAF1JWV9_9PROT|nr:iron-sulfur cluster assembly accessory protein [Plastoroseomonas arctica]MBR0655579.1 iron-sulfur cluster assembly accessory protein [Plastoroseomonas arctica]
MPDGTIVAPFRITPRAAAQVAEIAVREGKPGAGLRLAVDAGGCSGFQYRFAIEEAPAEDDLVVEGESARVFVDPVSLDLLAGSELDWNEALIGAHFVVKNPQAASGCGCGASFALAG